MHWLAEHWMYLAWGAVIVALLQIRCRYCHYPMYRFHWSMCPRGDNRLVHWGIVIPWKRRMSKWRS